MDLKPIDSLVIDNKVLSFKPGYNNQNTGFIDLFYDGIIEIALSILINKYLRTVII